MSDFDLKKNAYPVCPYCGEDQIFAFEFFGDIRTTLNDVCEYCHEFMSIKLEEDGTYTTSKTEEKNDN